MVDPLAATLNLVNILLCAGTAVYAFRWLRIFRGGMMERPLGTLFASLVLFFIAATGRASLIWGITPPPLYFVDISIRTFAFVLLLFSVVTIVHLWTNIGQHQATKS